MHNYEVTSGASVTEVMCVGGTAAGEDSGIALDHACCTSVDYGASGIDAERPNCADDLLNVGDLHCVFEDHCK